MESYNPISNIIFDDTFVKILSNGILQPMDLRADYDDDSRVPYYPLECYPVFPVYHYS